MNKFQKLAVKIAKDEEKYRGTEKFQLILGDITLKTMIRQSCRVLREHGFEYREALRFKMYCKSMNEEWLK